MNRRQITILWLSLTILLPAVYFIVSRGCQIENRVGANRAIRENKMHPGTCQIEDTTGKMWIVKADHYPVSEAEVEKLIASGKQLSEFEVKAWHEKDAIDSQRRIFWELSITGVFIFASITGLLLYRTGVTAQVAARFWVAT